MLQYDVLVAEDETMPAGHDWMLIEHDNGVLFVIRRRALGSTRVMADAWAGYRSLLTRNRQEPPTLRAV